MVEVKFNYGNEEDRKLILEMMSDAAPAAGPGPAKAPAKEKPAFRKEASKKEAPKKEAPKKEASKKEETPAAEEGMTLAQLQASVADFAKANGPAKVMEILDEFDIAKLSELKVADYAVFTAKLEEG